jgi:biopolymer transport protein ExbB
MGDCQKMVDFPRRQGRQSDLSTMIDYFLKGGLLMYPLAACSLIALAVILEKAILFARARTPKGQTEAVLQAAREGRLEQARALCIPASQPQARLFTAALESRDLPRADIENALSRLGSRELKHLGQRLHWLELVGRIAPMLGLTGTVTGLTRAFRTVAALKQVTDPSLLASGIWEALITTIAGLFIGIPALIAYHLYENRLRALAFELKTSNEELVAALTKRR